MPMDDAQLDALIRASRLAQQLQEVEVAPEAVHAYLCGTATAEQKVEVRRALARSAAFRRELLELAAYLDSMSVAPGAVEARAPARQAGETPRTRLGRGLAGVRQWFSVAPPRWVAIAPVAALLVAVVVVPVARERRFLPLIPAGTQALDVRDVTAGTGTPRGEAHTQFEGRTQFEALLGSLRGAIMDHDGYSFVTPPPPATVEFPVDLTVRLIGGSGGTAATVQARAPSGKAAAELQAATAWIVTLQPADGSVLVQSLPVTRRRFTLRKPGEEPAVFALTFGETGRFQATPCWRFPEPAHLRPR